MKWTEVYLQSSTEIDHREGLKGSNIISGE